MMFQNLNKTHQSILHLEVVVPIQFYEEDFTVKNVRFYIKISIRLRLKRLCKTPIVNL